MRGITDEVGAVVERHDDRPFGEDVAPLTDDPNRFAGKQLDPETALVDERAVSERVDGAARGVGAPRATSRGVRRGAAPRIDLRRALLPSDMGTVHAGGPRARRRGDDRSTAVEPVCVCAE